jgi:hypothetical protein
VARVPPPTFAIELRPEGPGPPPAIRLRGLLKAALRRFGLRCVDVRLVDPVPPTKEGSLAPDRHR